MGHQVLSMLNRLQNRRFFYFELPLIVFATLLAFGLQVLLTSGCCVGPDLVAYERIANLQGAQSNFWLSADAFNENFWGMLYPTFLHYSMEISGGSLEFVQWIQRLMVAALVPAVWLLTAHLGPKVRITSAFVLALSPTSIWLGNSFGYEVLLAFLLTYGVVLAWIIKERQFESRPFLLVLFPLFSGILIGLAMLAQSKALIIVPVVLYLLWRQSRRSALWGIAGIFIPLIPWMVRNFYVLGTFSPLSNNAGYNLWVGNSPEAILGGSVASAPPLPAGATSQLGAALTFMIEQPEATIDLIFRKVMRLWQPIYAYPEIVEPGPGRFLLHIFAGVLAALILFGFLAFLGGRLFVSPPRVPDVTPLAIFVLLFCLSHLPFIAEPRFMSAVLPVTLSVAVPTVLYLGQHWERLLKPSVGRSNLSEKSLE